MPVTVCSAGPPARVAPLPARPGPASAVAAARRRGPATLPLTESESLACETGHRAVAARVSGSAGRRRAESRPGWPCNSPAAALNSRLSH